MYVRCKLCNMKVQIIQKISCNFREEILQNVNILGARFNSSGTPLFHSLHPSYHRNVSNQKGNYLQCIVFSKKLKMWNITVPICLLFRNIWPIRSLLMKSSLNWRHIVFYEILIMFKIKLITKKKNFLRGSDQY